jgi:CheY-like chemotaxis protein
MGGLALLKELKAIDPEVRFIAVSGGMKYEDRDKFIAQGALMVLDKPVDTRFLRLVAGLCLDGANRPKEGALKNARVLIADDEEDSREILGELIMQRLGCMVDTAENGERALELYKQGADLMITDLHMPKMNGLELIKKAREHNPEAKILVMSGGARDEEKKVCIDAGAMHMFGKPVNTHELIGLAGLILDSGK